MLWLPGADGSHAWQDHDSYVVRADQWPAQPYATAPGREVVVLVNGVPGSDTRTLARSLAAELRIPLFSQDVIAPSVTDALWVLLRDSPVGGVVEGWFRPGDTRFVAEGLQRCGLDPATVPEVWCFSAQVEASAQPLGLGPTVAVDTGNGVGRAVVVRIALRVGAGMVPASET